VISLATTLVPASVPTGSSLVKLGWQPTLLLCATLSARVRTAMGCTSSKQRDDGGVHSVSLCLVSTQAYASADVHAFLALRSNLRAKFRRGCMCMHRVCLCSPHVNVHADVRSPPANRVMRQMLMLLPRSLFIFRSTRPSQTCWTHAHTSASLFFSGLPQRPTSGTSQVSGRGQAKKSATARPSSVVVHRDPLTKTPWRSTSGSDLDDGVRRYSSPFAH
jgi:hypothetical protein